MAVSRYRGIRDHTTALPRVYGTTVALELPVFAFRCLATWQAWPAGFRLASTTVDLPRYGAVYRVPRACASTTAGLVFTRDDSSNLRPMLFKYIHEQSHSSPLHVGWGVVCWGVQWSGGWEASRRT